jgi:Type II CAAX prenyl endopeptidase Rce1-like
MLENDIIQYLKRPFLRETEEDVKFTKRLSNIFTTYLIYLLFALASYIILSLIDKVLVEYFYKYSILGQQKLNIEKLHILYGHYVVIVVVIIGPLLEEIIFRLPLKLEKISIGLSLALIIYRCSGGHFSSFNFNNPYSYVRIIIIICLVLATNKYFPIKWIDFIKERWYSYFFYLSAFAFAFVHIANFAPYNYEVILFYPLFTLPQFIMGVATGYIRMRHGFLAGWALHALINLPFVLFT